MPIGEFCNRQVVFATRDMSIEDAAQLMLRHHVGDLVVVEERDGRRVPVGMLTDRDITVELIARSLDSSQFSVADIMSSPLVSVAESEGVYEVIHLMNAKGMRRIAVVNRYGGLAGIVTADDLLDLLADELAQLARLAPREAEREAQTRH